MGRLLCECAKCWESQSIRSNEKALHTHTNTFNPPASAASPQEGSRSHGVTLLLLGDLQKYCDLKKNIHQLKRIVAFIRDEEESR